MCTVATVSESHDSTTVAAETNQALNATLRRCAGHTACRSLLESNITTVPPPGSTSTLSCISFFTSIDPAPAPAVLSAATAAPACRGPVSLHTSRGPSVSASVRTVAWKDGQYLKAPPSCTSHLGPSVDKADSARVTPSAPVSSAAGQFRYLCVVNRQRVHRSKCKCRKKNSCSESGGHTICGRMAHIIAVSTLAFLHCHVPLSLTTMSLSRCATYLELEPSYTATIPTGGRSKGAPPVTA